MEWDAKCFSKTARNTWVASGLLLTSEVESFVVSAVTFQAHASHHTLFALSLFTFLCSPHFQSADFSIPRKWFTRGKNLWKTFQIPLRINWGWFSFIFSRRQHGRFHFWVLFRNHKFKWLLSPLADSYRTNSCAVTHCDVSDNRGVAENRRKLVGDNTVKAQLKKSSCTVLKSQKSTSHRNVFVFVQGIKAVIWGRYLWIFVVVVVVVENYRIFLFVQFSSFFKKGEKT